MQTMMRRRQFLKLLATSAAGSVLFQACATGSPRREFRIESPAQIPEDALYGSDAWFATVCRGCSAGCGVVARVFEGRAKKLEGNPNHPVNQGGLCARGQAAVQDLYHPDRIQTPLRRTGERGAGAFEAIGWDQALDGFVQALRDHGQGNGLVTLTEPLSGPLRLVADRFVTALGGQRLSFAPLEEATLREAMRRVFGAQQLPTFDLANARFVLSFGADFLHTWIAPVQLSRAYGVFRQGRPGQRGTLIQIEPRMSGTAAVADRWAPVQPGSEGLLALAMARVILDEGLADSAGVAAFGQNALLASAAPEDVAAATGVPADTIRNLARRFATERPSLALGGGSAAAHTNGLFNLTAIYALNLLVGAVNQPGGVLLPAQLPAGFDAWQPDAPASANDWTALGARLRTGQPAPVGLLLVHAANPLYGLPNAGFADALANVPSIISFSRYLDETTAYADLVLPDHTDLESWGATLPTTGTPTPTVGFQQPVVQPFYGTRAFADVLLTVAEELGGAALEALPWNTFQDVVRDAARQLQQVGGEPADADFERLWVELLQRGVWTAPAEASAQPAAPTLPTQPQAAAFAGGADEYPFQLLPYPSATLGAGEHAHLPWLQALPDPITTATWSSWIEVNAGDARALGVGTGDVARIVTPQGQAEAPVYVHPAAPPGILAVPLGQGHRFYGRYAAGRGINALELVAPQLDTDSGALAWAATRARLEKTGRQATLPRFEGSVTPRAPADYPIVRVTSQDD